MLFSVIYSFDVPGDESVNQYYPSNWRKLWDLTECEFAEDHPQYDDYLPIHERPKHRKIVALLTKDEFLSFIDECGLSAEPCETGGSIGAPGFGFGWAPAISFDRWFDYEGGYANAYVTPILFAKFNGEREIVECLPNAFPLKEKHWDRIRDFIVSKL